MKGVSVSLYNKFDDLEILLDIIRNNWEDDYYISVCSNHPNAEEKISHIRDDIDCFKKGMQIQYSPSMSGIRESANLWYRVYNTMRTACKNAISEENVDFVMHLHADAWQLSERGFQSIVDEMNQRDASVAFKSSISAWENTFPGYFMDQFIIFDADSAEKSGLFNRNTFEYPPETSTHGLLPMICLTKFGWGKIYNYSNRSEEEYWDGKSVLDDNNRVRPMMYNPYFGQLHIATEDFPDTLGKSLQAYYLFQHEIKSGENIREFLDEYQLGEDKLFYEIESWIKDLNNTLRWYGLSVDSFDRDMRDIRPFVNYPKRKKIKRAIHQHLKETELESLAISIYHLKEKIVHSFRNKDEEGGNELGEYENIHKLYLDKLNTDDYPQEFHEKYSYLEDQ